MKIKTKDLIGPTLDWVVAKCEGATEEWRSGGPFLWGQYHPAIRIGGHDVNYRPSESWAEGGPIIERENIGLLASTQSPCNLWHASYLHPDISEYTGPTPLIAAMRCRVANDLGDEVEIPEELV